MVMLELKPLDQQTLFSEPFTAQYILHATYSILYYILPILRSKGTLSMSFVHSVVHRQSFLLFSPSNFINKCPCQDLVVTLQHIALWVTLGEVDWSDAYWEFPLNQYISGNFFWHTANFCLCLHPAYYTLLFGQIS